MISKDMLKEVLFYKEKYKDQVEITRLVLNKHYIEYTSDVTGNPYNYITHDKINVYELAHKCKEWAWLNYGFEIFTHRIKNEINYGKVKVRVIHKHNPSSDRQALLYFDKKIFKEECESIFKACQWILDNKES